MENCPFSVEQAAPDLTDSEQSEIDETYEPTYHRPK